MRDHQRGIFHSTTLDHLRILNYTYKYHAPILI